MYYILLQTDNPSFIIIFTIDMISFEIILKLMDVRALKEAHSVQ